MNQLSPSSNRIAMPGVSAIALSLLLFALLLTACADVSAVPEDSAASAVVELGSESSTGDEVDSAGDSAGDSTGDSTEDTIDGSTDDTAQSGGGVAHEGEPEKNDDGQTGVDETGAKGPASVAGADAVEISDSLESDAVSPLDQTTNILVLGSDRRPDTPNWRTDVMMIIALDRENGRAGVISIPRDVFIEEIPNHEPNRVNVIDYLGELDEPDGGGPALLAGIIERDMGIHIDHYLRFSFDSFREVVDALGGVPVDIDCEFRGYIEDEGGWLVLEPGTHRLAGNQAMIYVRDRQLTGGDLSRARRQQRFVWAVRNQVLDENLVTRIPALYTALSGSVDTDIGLVTTLQLARLALALDPDDLYGMVLTPPEMLEEGWALGMAVFLPDWETIAENVQLVFDSPPFMINNTPEECR